MASSNDPLSTLPPAPKTSAAEIASDFRRQRTIIQAVEGSDVICWTCDLDDRVTCMEGAAVPEGHERLLGEHMSRCPFADVYFRAKDLLLSDPKRPQVRFLWTMGGRSWLGTFSRLYRAGRPRGISVVSMPIDDAQFMLSDDREQPIAFDSLPGKISEIESWIYALRRRTHDQAGEIALLETLTPEGRLLAKARRGDTKASSLLARILAGEDIPPEERPTDLDLPAPTLSDIDTIQD